MNLTIELRARPEKFNELYQTLQALLPTMRREDGCLECRIYRDMEDGEVFFLSVSWEDEGKCEKYMRSTGGSAFLGAIDLLSETVRVRLGENSQWDRIEVLKKMRILQR